MKSQHLRTQADIGEHVADKDPIFAEILAEISRLRDQVSEITADFAAKIEEKSTQTFLFGEARVSGSGEEKDNLRRTQPPLPDHRLVRHLIRLRQARTKYFESDLFSDPAWDMLLDLTAARVEHRRVSVTSLCIASGVPPTTALRWIGQMVDSGVLRRIEDPSDRRRAFVELTDEAVRAMARFFAEAGGYAKYPL